MEMEMKPLGTEYGDHRSLAFLSDDPDTERIFFHQANNFILLGEKHTSSIRMFLSLGVLASTNPYWIPITF